VVADPAKKSITISFSSVSCSTNNRIRAVGFGKVKATPPIRELTSLVPFAVLNPSNTVEIFLNRLWQATGIVDT
jgi:hypothetical protein